MLSRFQISIEVHIKAFIGTLLSNKLDILSNNDAEIFWKEKENMENNHLNPHTHLSVYNSTVSRTMQKAVMVEGFDIPAIPTVFNSFVYLYSPCFIVSPLPFFFSPK